MKEYPLLQSYIINPKTMIILPFERNGSGVLSLVIEEEASFVVLQKPFDVLDKSCRSYGCSFEGRKEGSKELLQETHKLSVCVDSFNKLYFFPTTSYASKFCIWVSHSHVKRVVKIPHNDVRVSFINGLTLRLPISKSSFDRQFHRAGDLRHKMESLIDHNSGRKYHVVATGLPSNVMELSNPYLVEEPV